MFEADDALQTAAAPDRRHRPVIADAGGLPCVGGTVREGRLLRVAGALAGAAELARLEDAGVRAYVDLRGDPEDRSVIEGWAREAGVDYRRLPIDVAGAHDLMRAVRDAEDAVAATAHMRALYREIVERNGATLAAAVGVVAAGTPVAFGCTAGKDRTGIVAALVHALVGVPDEEIARSYVACAPEVQRLRGVLQSQFGMAEELLEAPGLDVLLGVEEMTIRATLAHLRREHGGIEEYLVAHGLPTAAPARLREDLVDAG
jgi:protein-tyrosine phosphatase